MEKKRSKCTSCSGVTLERLRFSLSLSLSLLALLLEKVEDLALCGPDVGSLVASNSPSEVRGIESSRFRDGVSGDKLAELSGESDASGWKLSSGFRSKLLGSKWSEVRLP